MISRELINLLFKPNYKQYPDNQKCFVNFCGKNILLYSVLRSMIRSSFGMIPGILEKPGKGTNTAMPVVESGLAALRQTNRSGVLKIAIPIEQAQQR